MLALSCITLVLHCCPDSNCFSCSFLIPLAHTHTLGGGVLMVQGLLSALHMESLLNSKCNFFVHRTMDILVTFYFMFGTFRWH